MNTTKSRPTGRLSRSWHNALTLGASLAATLLLAPAVFANGSMLDYTALPPLISPFSLSDMPNVLVVLDNSNSMDEAPNGTAVGSADPSSKSEIARHTIKGLIQSLQGRIRMGLMAYQQSNVKLYYIHNSFYYASYDPSTYDPSYVPGGAPSTWTKNNQRIPNPTDTGNYLYYNRALPYYDSSDQGNAFCYSDTYSETVDPTTGKPVYNSYDCYRTKTGQSDAHTGYSNYMWSGSFKPTDSDTAQGFYYFGQRLAWQKVHEPDPDHPGQFTNKTYFSDSHPGRGYLYVPVNTLDASQASTLDSWLATESFANPSSNKPLRNAGFTPIQGTLLTAKDYFEGNLTDTAQGGPANAPPANACGVKNYVILVTDGLPSVDKDGNLVTDPNTAITDAANAARQLSAIGVKTYVVGFGLPQGVDSTKLDQIASAGDTASAYLASDSASLLNALNSIFLDIAKRTSSGTAATVVSNSSNGTGAVYQAYYTPSMTLAQNVSGGALSTVTWVGGVHALFIDKYSYLREDGNQNGKLDDYDADKIVELQYDPGSGKTVVARATSTDPNVPKGLTWTTGPLGGLKPIWNAQDRLANLTDVVTQRTYRSNASQGRYIFTTINGTKVDFDETQFGSGGGDNYLYLDAGSTAQAQKIVDYIRGEEIPGFRNRTIDYKQDGTLKVWRLGDIIHSTPAAVGAPDAGYDVTYGDTSYAAFRQQYANRRQVVYVGANDGMLHAFNGGFWNVKQQSFDTVDPSGSGATPDPLGSELWAYVPENLLPHLQWLTDPNYNHVYYMDGAIKTFDARIFTADADHPYGWGTILVAGMRLGGGPFSIDTTGDGNADTTMRSAYVVMDITNPEKPPRLLAEITSPKLGFTTSGPALVKAAMPSNSGDWGSPLTKQWYLVFGSGPTDLVAGTSNQDAQLFVYNLNTLSFETGFAPLDLTGAPDSFVGDVSVADWNRDFLDDAAYFGIAGGTTGSPTGELDRLVLNSSVSTTGGTVTAPNLLSGATVNTLLNIGKPFLNAPTLSTDVLGAHWVYGGTGRLLASADNTSTAQQSVFGVKEPVDSSGQLTWGAANNLADVTGIGVYSDGTITPTGTTIDGNTVATTTDVEQAIQNMDGWVRQLGTGGPAERVLSSPVVARQVLLFPSYTPDSNVCEPEGTSLLYAVDTRAGIALPFDPLYADQHTGNAKYKVVDTYDMGKGETGQLSVHQGGALGPGKAKILHQNSTLDTSMINFNTGAVQGGRRSWREIDLQNLP